MKDGTAGRLSVLSRAGLAVLVVLIMCLGPLGLTAYADSTYTVQPGDTLISIAARYGTTVDAIVTANNLPSRSTIYSGQVLKIPSPGSTPASKPPSGGNYTVQAGDTLSDIALRYGTTVAAIMQANGLTSSVIYAGQSLVIPGAQNPPPAPPTATGVPPTAPPATQPPRPTQQPTQPAQPPSSGPVTYTVQRGDNLSTIAARFGVDWLTLAAYNGLNPNNFLFAGQVLKIPGKQQQPTAQPTSKSVPTAVATTTPVPATPGTGGQSGKPVRYTVQYGDNLSSIAMKFSTTVEALAALNNLGDGNYLRVGQVLTIVKGDDQEGPPAGGTPGASKTPTTPTPEPTPPMGKFGIKWIDVNLTNQTMVAYEGQVPVFSSLMSSGIPSHPTVEGTYRIYAKYQSTLMKGGEGAEYYYLPNVPYTMYFYSGYALHGAYWHNNFGHPMSHGCVNLPVDAAKWMFGWAPIGTMVVTHK